MNDLELKAELNKWKARFSLLAKEVHYEKVGRSIGHVGDIHSCPHPVCQQASSAFSGMRPEDDDYAERPDCMP